MMTTTQWLRDPTAETAALKRARTKPPQSLEGLTIGLFDIGKTRSDEFLDQVEARFSERKLKVKRYAKPTNAKVAPAEVVERVVAEADVVLIALSD
jgi:phosphopantothenate synthetase